MQPRPAALRLAAVTTKPLDVAAHLAAVDSQEAGAVATFVGQVRDHDPGAAAAVVRIDYSAHPDADAVLARIARDHADADGVLGLAVSHRTGSVAVGETALVACVATAHRQLAFRVCRALVESVKRDLPMWKRQVLDDGTHVWAGL